MSFSIRAAGTADGPFLADMLVEAAFWRPDGPRGRVDEVLRDPALAHYISGWPRDGDLGVVAVDDVGGGLVGAAWLRYFTDGDPGYGFVDASTPELSMGVVRRSRGQGVGTGLLQALVEVAHGAQVSALSLSVEPDNHARHLYERFDFAAVGRRNGSITMLLRLRRRAVCPAVEDGR